jgi:RimJ/RimL family protein N-acetyltransferase
MTTGCGSNDSASAQKQVEAAMIDISMLSSRYEIRRMELSDADDILNFCRKNTLFYQYCEAEPSKEQVINDLQITPPGIDPSDKYYIGFFRGEELVAVMDLIDGYPEPDMGFIGFFMMNADLQGKQIGSGIIQDVCAYLKRTGKTAVRLGIAKENPQAKHFWRKNGFITIKEVERVGWTVLVAEKKL